MDDKILAEELAKRRAAPTTAGGTPDSESDSTGESSPSERVGSTLEQVAELPEDLTKDPRVRKWQSAYDKRIAALQKRIQELEAAASASASTTAAGAATSTDRSTPPPSDPRLQQERDALLTQFDEAQKAYEQLSQEGKVTEAVAAGVRLERLAERLFDLDLRLGAAKYGLSYDELVADARKAHEEGEITDGLSLDYWLLRRAYAHPYRDREQRLAEQERQLAEREKQLAAREQAIEEEIRRRVAEMLQKSGATSVPAITGGTPSRKQQLLDALRTADLYTALAIRRQLAALEEEENA